MADVSPQSVAAAREQLGVDPDKLPRSVAVIMDGNGRWARKRGLPRTEGHAAGAQSVRHIINEAARLGLDALMLYSFSSENWRRPAEEVQALMHLYAEHIRQDRPTLMENNIRLRHLGRRDRLPQAVLDELDESKRVSADNTGMWLCLALDYGSREEIVDTVRDIASRAKSGQLDSADIDEHTLHAGLQTHDIPDPDLLIRTSGEMRVSNFLLWQVSYAEFYVTETYWPDFKEPQFHEALKNYATRERRFGGLKT